MKPLRNKLSPRTVRNRTKPVVTMRLIVLATTVVLIVAAVVGVSGLSEQHTRGILTQEIETRLVVEARNLALIGSGALLSDYPELTLYPVVRQMKSERPDLAMVAVVDLSGIIQGYDEAASLGTPFELGENLTPARSATVLHDNEKLLTNEQLLVVATPILHPNGQTIGTAYVGRERSYGEALLTATREKQALLLAVVLTVAVFLTLVVISSLLRPIEMLRAGLERIGQGDLDTRLTLSSLTELGSLGKTVNEMATRLKRARADLIEKERLHHEMQLAKEIQRSLLPDRPARVREFTIAGAQEAAADVGGDYYDVIDLPDGRVGVVIADVAGKGLSGCLVTSMIAVLIRTLSPVHKSPSAMMSALHDALIGSLQPGMFVTMFYGILDPANGQLAFASAGHNPLLQYHHNGQITWHRTTGIPLGLIGGDAVGACLVDHHIEIEPGDVLLQYTDGISEAMNVDDQQFGFERMADLLVREAPKGYSRVIETLQKSVRDWERPQAASDDKTLVIIGREHTRGTRRKVNKLPGISRELRGGLATRLWGRRQNHLHLSLPAQLDALDKISPWLSQVQETSAPQGTDLLHLEQGLYELCANIAEHGCALDAHKKIDIWWLPPEVEATVGSEGARSTETHGYFLVRDFGKPPDTMDWSSPALDSPTVRQAGRGLGLRIIARTFDHVALIAGTPEGNITILKVRLPERQTS